MSRRERASGCAVPEVTAISGAPAAAGHPHVPQQVSATHAAAVDVLWSLGAELHRLLWLGCGLGPTAISVLQTLARSGPRRLAGLSELGGVREPSMTVLLLRLQQRGLVGVRQGSARERTPAFVATAAGRSLVEEMEAQCRTVLAGLLGSLPDSDVKLLAEALPALRRVEQQAALVAGRSS